MLGEACVFQVAQVNKGSPILEIIYPKAGKVRARAVVSRSGSKATRKRPSWKMGRMMQCESPHERNAVVLLDVCPEVTAFYEQPLAVRYRMNGEAHTHYPDLLVEYGQRRELLEVKTWRDANSPDVAARTRILESHLPEHGFTYRIATAEELKREPRLSTALGLLKHGWAPISAIDREHVRQILQSAPHITWASALSGDLGPRGCAVLARLVLEGVLQIDMEQPLTGSARFTWCSSSKEAIE